MSKEVELLTKSEVECCKEELNNYIEFMKTAGDNAGWARGLRWYIGKLEKQLADSTPNEVIRENLEIIIDKLEKVDFGGWADELRDTLEEILEGEKE